MSERRRRPPARGGALAAVLLPIALSGLVVAIAIGAAAYTYRATYDSRVYLGVSSLGLDLGGRTRDEARVLLAAAYQQMNQTPIVLRTENKQWRALPSDLGVRFLSQESVDSAYAVGRQGGPLEQTLNQIAAFRDGYSIGQTNVAVDQAKRTTFLNGLAREIDEPATSAQLALKPDQQVTIQKPKAGRRLSVERTSQAIDQAIARWALPSATPGPGASRTARVDEVTVNLVVQDVPPAISEAALAAPAEQARKLMSAPVVLRLDGRTWTIDPDQIQGAISFAESESGGQKRVEPVLDEAPLRKTVEDIARATARPAKNARFDYSSGKLTPLSAGADGRRVDVNAALPLVKAALAGDNRTVDLPVVAVKPTIGSGDGAKLAIRGLIQQASTSYDVGTAERRYNVELAASRLHGVVVEPGDVFSFNDEVGEVSYRSGYKQGYGITRTANGDLLTIPSEGGGICQVATTLFHAVFWGGYPIVERNWHSYWIPRYGLAPKGMKGLDATIDQIFDEDGKLVSEIDLRFRNSSDSYLLVQARYDRKNLTFQLWGTKPGWDVKIDPPKIEKEVKADQAVVRQADSSMPPGSEIMVEEARDGFQATIVRAVSQDGKPIEQRAFVSTYRPSRNVYLFGPKATPTPTPTRAPAPKPSG